MTKVMWKLYNFGALGIQIRVDRTVRIQAAHR